MFRTVPLSIFRSFSLYKQQWYVIQVCWHTPLLCVQWKTPEDGQRNCPKHVEFYSKNKFEKSVHQVGFIIRIYDDARSPDHQILYYIITRIQLSCCCLLFATCGISPSFWSKRDWNTFNKFCFRSSLLTCLLSFFIPFLSVSPLFFPTSSSFFSFISCFSLTFYFLREFIFLASCFSDGYSNKFSVIVRWLRIWGTAPYGKKVTGDFSRKYSETNDFLTVCYLS